MNKFYRNGYIIKSYEEQPFYDYKKDYFGIGRFVTWPLHTMQDSQSLALSDEAFSWYGFQDHRPWVVPDLDFLHRYVAHCKTLNISTFCLKVESMCPLLTSDVDLPVSEFLGYDYSDVDMETSCFVFDMQIKGDNNFSIANFCKDKLNKKGLFKSLDNILDYIAYREKMISNGYDIDDFYAPLVVKLSKVNLNHQSIIN